MDLKISVSNMISECVDWIRAAELPQGGLPSEYAGSYSCAWTTAGLLWAAWSAGTSFHEFYMRKALNWTVKNRNPDLGIPQLKQGDYSITDATGQTAIACTLAYHDTAEEFFREELDKCVKWLLYQQLGDTGWNWRYSSEASWLSSTVFAMLGLYCGLHFLGSKDDIQGAMDRTLDWIKRIQNADGGWGSCEGGVSRPAVTALVCSMLSCVDPEFDTAKAIHFILQQQRPDGSWSDTIDRPTALSIERIGTSYAIMALADCGYPLESREFRSAFAALTRSYEKGTFQFRDTEIVSWPTRDGLLALCSMGRRLKLDSCRAISDAVKRQSAPPSPPPARVEGAVVIQKSAPDKPVFRIELRPQGINSISVHSFDTPLGEAAHTANLPFTLDELPVILKALQVGKYTPDLFPPPETQVLEQLDLLDHGAGGGFKGDPLQVVGRCLYETVFQSDLEPAFRMAFNQSRKLREPLHLELRFPENAPSIARYPWELFHDGRRHLISGGAVELTRYISYPESRPPFELSRPLHILFASSRPRELGRLSADAEWTAVSTALQPYIEKKEVFLDRLERATYDALRERFEEGLYQILHLDGHGAYARLCPNCHAFHYPHYQTCLKCKASMETVKPAGFFAFEDNARRADFVSSQELQNIIITSKINLAVVSSCQSSLIQQGSVFGGLGPGLIQSGVPAVIAMQLDITSGSALKFAASLYGKLLQGVSLPAAIGAGRKAVFRQNEWYIPTLWLRSRT
ncbi:MAG: CHAT domain-containing protein [Chloroflexia bacterium]|nr:CHAT domain-containing protein [Chloroflexia bacterium]